MQVKLSILIVDDNISLCKTMDLILRQNGCAVTTAGDGLEAIERVKEMPFDMIFMDIKMPLINGVETYRRIKQIRPGAVVTMMTAYSDDGLIFEALQEGARGVLSKPLDIGEVLGMIDELLERRQEAG